MNINKIVKATLYDILILSILFDCGYANATGYKVSLFLLNHCTFEM